MEVRIKALLFFSILLAGVSLPAQDPLVQLVDFNCLDCAPADALVQLSRQTGVNIVFNDRFFSQCKPVTVQAQQESFKNILEKISSCSKTAYKVTPTQVVFFRRTQKHTLSGYVQDAQTGERLLGASLRVLSDKGLGTLSNEFGFFSFKLEEGIQRIATAYIGYQSDLLEMDLTADRFLTIKLRTSSALPEITIIGRSSKKELEQDVKSHKSLSLKDLRSIPMPGGETDLMRQAALQTGIQTGVDGLGGLYVRGGNSDQNLVLLDDVPVYNPSHALGFFSIFNTATISSARLWKGDFPARYGGRVSSVLDVRTRDGDLQNYHLDASVGLFASSLALEGPVLRGRSSFLVGLRGTYFEPWVKFFSQRGSLLTFSGKQVDYRFYDINLKWNYILSDKDRLYFSFYRGGDHFQNEYNQFYRRTEGVYTNRYSLASEWGNTIAALRWNHLLRKNLFTNTTLRYSRFFYQSSLGFNSLLLSNSGRTTTQADYAQLYQTLISAWSGKTDFTYYPDDRLTLRWGASYTLHDFQPGAVSVNFLQPGQSPTSIDSLSNLLTNNERLNADEAEAYFDTEIKPFRYWFVEAGVNTSVFQIKNLNYRSLQPRLRIQRSGPRGWRYWAGYHRTAQNLHQIGSFNISLPFELWVPSTRKVKPEQVWQLSAGWGWQGRGWAWQVEGYYKNFERVLAFLPANDVLFTGGAEDASGWEDRIASGTGRSRGVELSLEKNTGALTGSVAYTLSQSIRHFSEINSDRPFPFRFDRRHDLKITLQQRFARWLSADGIWSFATGNPITLGNVRFTHQTPGSESSQSVFVFTEVNGYRLPNYHRLDLALNAHFATRRLRHTIQIGVYNVYNRSNPSFILLDAESGVKGKAIQYTLLPLLPSFRYGLRF